MVDSIGTDHHYLIKSSGISTRYFLFPGLVNIFVTSANENFTKPPNLFCFPYHHFNLFLFWLQGQSSVDGRGLFFSYPTWAVPFVYVSHFSSIVMWSCVFTTLKLYNRLINDVIGRKGRWVFIHDIYFLLFPFLSPPFFWFGCGFIGAEVGLLIGEKPGSSLLGS